MSAQTPTGSAIPYYSVHCAKALYLNGTSEELAKLAGSFSEALFCEVLSFSGNKSLSEDLLLLWETKCPRISELDLSSTNPLHLDRLATLEKLSKLDLSATVIDSHELSSYLRRQTTLKTLCLDGVTLSAAAIQELLDSSPQLLNFSNTDNKAMTAHDWSLIQSHIITNARVCVLNY